MMITFSVDQQADWQPVIAYLFATAEAAPLDHADSDNYSKSKQQFSERMGRILEDKKKIEAASAYSVLIKHESRRLISLVMTSEPGNVHLSIMQVFPQIERLSDALAGQIADILLGDYEKRSEGIMAGVHHFYRYQHTVPEKDTRREIETRVTEV